MRILTLLVTAGLILVILGVALSIGSKVTDDIANNMCSAGDVNLACSGNSTGLSSSYDTAYAAAHNSTLAVADLAEWQSTISTVVAAVVIIGLLLAGFGGFLAFGGKRV
jgi:hypothetical protein